MALNALNDESFLMPRSPIVNLPNSKETLALLILELGVS